MSVNLLMKAQCKLVLGFNWFSVLVSISLPVILKKSEYAFTTKHLQFKC